MNKKTRLIRTGLAAAFGVMMAGSGVAALASAMGIGVSWLSVYGAALLSALLAGICSWSGGAAAIASVALVVIGGVWTAMNLDAFPAMRALFASWQGNEADAALIAQGGRMLIAVSAYVLGAVFAWLMSRKEFVPLGILVFFGLTVGAYSVSDTISIGCAVPGLIAAVAGFAFANGIQRDANGLRVLIPAALAVALAMMFVPGDRLTWQPLENAANRVRGVFEQYFNFSRERIAFSINEKGYDHAGKINDEVVAMLGGPANPDTTPVMRVQADQDVLLRGTIRTTYTGYSWVDTQVKNRYLYYDITHRSVRDRIFGQNVKLHSAAFDEINASVEMLDEGTSTLFVPGRMSDFSMDMSNAVYYNSAGEIFMAREVAAGDKYSLKALQPNYSEALRAAVIGAQDDRDDYYDRILEQHTQLPAGIEGGVHSLTIELTESLSNPYDKALAIQEYLLKNCRYTLETDYPPEGRDFVSYFLLDSKEGYCSYFASAMAVMGRIAGLPTRYVEGYLARPDLGGSAVLTGENAHAWTEIYFNGVGWIPFDASGGQDGSQNSDAEDDSHEDHTETESDLPMTEPTPTPSPTPALHPDEGETEPSQEPETTPEPSLPPEDEDQQPEESQEPEEEDSELPWNQGQEPDNPTPEAKKNSGWIWILLAALLILALIALAVLWVRRRLQQADPIWLVSQTRSAQQASMILYRAILTLLSQMGQAPISGESPEAFVERIARQFNNADYVAFVQAVSMSRYARKPLAKADIDAGRKAYNTFKNGMRFVEKVKFALVRIFHGLGDFESIP